MNSEQYNFDFESAKQPPKSPETPEVKYNLAEKDECDYCGAPFESERSCRYCRSNPTKSAFLKGKS